MASAQATAPPPFKEELLTIIHKLVDLPISHGLISRMKQLEHLLTHFEAREFTYYDHRDLVVSRNCMLALWMYLLKNIDQISVLKYQDIAYRMIRALLMRKEFYLSNLGYTADCINDPFENQTEDEQKCCRVYRKLLVETFLYAADILPLCLSDTSTHTSREAEQALKDKAIEKSIQTAKNRGFRVVTDSSEADRPNCVRRFCTMVFAFAFLRIPAIQGPVIESLTWRLMNQEQLMEATTSAQGQTGSKEDKPTRTLKEVIKMPKARKLIDLHAKFINSNPHLFAWSALARPDDATKAVPEDPSWLYSLGRDGLIFVDFFLQMTRQVLEVAIDGNVQQGTVGEKKDIPWLSVPGYSLFVELYAPLLGFSLVQAVDKAAGLVKKKGAAVGSPSDDAARQLKELPPAPQTLQSAPTSWIDKFAPQDQPKPSMFQISQMMEMGFTRAQSIVALMHTATVSSAYLDNVTKDPSIPKYVMDSYRAVEFALVEDMRKMVDDLGGEEEVEKSYDEARHLTKKTSANSADSSAGAAAVQEEVEEVHDLIDFSALSDFSDSEPVPPSPTSPLAGGLDQIVSAEAQEDPETLLYKSKVEEMEREKAKAVSEEDYMRAGQIKQFITDLTTAENLRLQLKAQLLEEEEKKKSQLMNEEALLFGDGTGSMQALSIDQSATGIQGVGELGLGMAADDGWFQDGMLGSTDLLVKALHEEAQHVSGKPTSDMLPTVGGGGLVGEDVSGGTLLDMSGGDTQVVSTTAPYVLTEQEECQEWANRMKAAAMSYLASKDDSDLEARQKALNDAVVVGSGVVLGNPGLLGVHVTSLLTSLHRLPKETSIVATPFTLEVAARWFHQASTRRLAMLGTIQVKIWVLPLSSEEIEDFINEFETLLVNTLEQDEKERAGGSATKALKQIITFLYHNIDLIHGAPRHKLMKMILNVAFMRMFINKSKEVMYGFHLLMVYKLLRFHRHHAGSSNDLDLLTTIGSKLLSMDQSRIMETMQEVANRKTSAADPWKGAVEVEELDIDRALQSHAHVLLDLVRDSKKLEGDTKEEEALKVFNSKQSDTVDLLQVEEESHSSSVPSSEQSDVAKVNDITVPLEGLSHVDAALANYSRNLWEYYVSGLKMKNDAALSVFAPPLIFAKAHDAFSPPRRVYIPGVSGPISGFTVYNPNASSFAPPPPPLAPPPVGEEVNNGLGRRIQNTPYSDGTTN